MGWRNAIALGMIVPLIAACAGDDTPSVDRSRGGPVQQGDERPRWQRLARVPTPRSEVAAAATQTHIYVMGGFAEGSGTVDTVEVYDIENDTWDDGPALRVAVNHPMAADLNGRIYIFGGYRGPGLDNATARSFVLRGGRWRRLPPMPQVRAAGGAAAVGKKLYVGGGVGPNGLARRTFVFNPRTRRWTKRASVPTHRQHLGVAGTKKHLFVVAGRTGGLDSNLDAFERYSPARRRWRKLRDVPTTRGGLAATATANGFVVAAGGEEREKTFDEVEAFDVRRGRWRSLPRMPTARHGLGVVAVGSVVYVLAGGPQPGLTYSGANEAIDLSSLRN